MNIAEILSTIVSPITTLIDDLVTSDEERLQIQQKIHDSEMQILEKFLEYESKLLDSKSKIIESEAKGESWLQRSWRPITMLSFLVLLFMYWFGIQPENLSQDTINKLFTLLQIGIGGYIVSRGAEKVLPKLFKLKKD